MTRQWVWRAAFAGLCGTAAHSLLMYLKFRLGLLPSFQPYRNLQLALGHLIGSDVHPSVPWALSYVNGSAVVGLIFGRAYHRLPGNNGAAKGLSFGLFFWVAMGLVFFPVLGLGVFATGIGLGIAPALFSLAMILTYTVTLGIVYAALRV